MRIRWAFLPVFGIALAIVFPVYLSSIDFGSLPTSYKALNTAIAILISLVAALILLSQVCIWRFLSKGWRKLLVKLALYTLERAFDRYVGPIEASGIGEKEGSIVIRLVGGSNASIAFGDKFEVLNTASSERWGVLEVIEVEGASCVGQVSDRINVEFWEQLESRVRRDHSPPTGVTFLRKVPGESLDFIKRLIRNWGG